MSVRIFATFACVGIGLLAIAGCRDQRATERERTGGPESPEKTEPAGKTVVTGANVINNQTAIERIVAARCSREATCKNFGPDKKFGTEQDCKQKLHSEMKDELKVDECPRGIDNKELGECLEAINKEECQSPLDTLGRIAACRTSDLCLH
ncbi:MAG TPA: DUF6184 family natural product biosynthesis lipoprotein [Labilithrix sp.]|nr:DUF6184 family natural product biosynthesis lipoprotein [Labilithrix sp.]